MKINFYKSQSFEIQTDDFLLQFHEVEEFSFVFISTLCQQIKLMFRKGVPALQDNFYIDFPFDMIDGYFEQNAEGLILIGWRYAGKGYTDREEIICSYKEFYPVLISALETFFTEIEQNTKLSKYIIDNAVERHKNMKPPMLWSWDMVETLKKYFKFISKK